ncbi:hypothetical protein FZC66_09115 [Priestia megaterium]|nr:hypothetical protein FZC66_09115 [Priestia megaterium]
MNNIAKVKRELVNLNQQKEVNRKLIKVSESLVTTSEKLVEEPDNPENLTVLAELEGQKEQLAARAKKLADEF